MSVAKTLAVNPDKLRVGCVAMLDALGFKGIWKRYPFEKVLERLRYIEARANEEQTFLSDNHPKLASLSKFELTVRYLSDTVVIAAHSSALVQSTTGFRITDGNEGFMQQVALEAADRKTAVEFVALKVVVGVVARVLGAAIIGNHKLPPFNLRGAVAHGEYLVSGNYLIGQAIDDCASLHQAPQGAFVVFHETASAFWNKCVDAREKIAPSIVRTGQLTAQDIKEYMTLREVLDYNVPLKIGCKRLHVVNPFGRMTQNLWSEMREVALNEMQTKQELTGCLGRLVAPLGRPQKTSSDDVAAKRQNTSDYLNFILEHAPPCFPP